MLLSKLDQRERCEACIGPHGDGESGGMRREVCVSRGGRESDGEGGADGAICGLIFGRKKKTKQRPASVFVRHSFCLFVSPPGSSPLPLSLTDLLCAWNTSFASACFISGPD